MFLLFKKNAGRLVTTALLIPVLIAGCGNTAKFVKKIEGMTDSDLIAYYHGINDKIKDIANEVSVKEHFDTRPDEDIHVQSPFFMGRQGYDLNHKKELIEKELIKRNLIP